MIQSDLIILYGGIIYVLLIAIIMTVFELIFFLVILVPKEKELFREKLIEMRTLMRGMFDTTFENKMDKESASIIDLDMEEMKKKAKEYEAQYSLKGFFDYLTVMTKREENLNTKINNDAVIFIVVEVVIFFIIIIMCINRLYTLDHRHVVASSILLAVITGIILAAFQYVMYIYAGGTHQQGSYQYASDKELKYNIMKKIENDLK